MLWRSLTQSEEESSARGPEYADRAGVILAGLRKLQTTLSDAAGRSRVTPSVVVALSGVRNRCDELMATAANGPAATLGQRLYIARIGAKLSPPRKPPAGWGSARISSKPSRPEEPATEDETGKIKDLIAALGG